MKDSKTIDMRIRPRTLTGRVAAVPSKSGVHRLLICAALADGPTELRISTLSEDTRATMGCLGALGAGISWQDGVCHIIPCRGKVTQKSRLRCVESGSTLRFLLPVAAALGAQAAFEGEGRLPQRPLGPLLAAMEENGCRFMGTGLPLRLEGALRPGTYILPGDVSSQFVSGLLMALPLLPGESEIALTGPLESGPYVDMTIQALARFGVTVIATEKGFRVPGNQRFASPGELSAEGDWSNAAFFLCAGALGGPVACTGLATDSLQGDKEIVTLLRRFGAQVEIDADTVTVSGGALRGIEIDAAQIPDLVPVLAAMAAGAQGTTRIMNAGRLRLKESDRLSAVAAMLNALGGRVEEGADSLAIHGGIPLSGGKIDGQGDHRIVMAGAIASCLCRGEVTILGAQATAKSYPNFFEEFNQLGGEAHVIHDRE